MYVQVNTFRRNDLLDSFLSYYTAPERAAACALIKEITVVWSDVTPVPQEIASKFQTMTRTRDTSRSAADADTVVTAIATAGQTGADPASDNAGATAGSSRGGGGGASGSKIRVVIEQHSTNSLNNRFLPLETPQTAAVLSIDDDLIIPCDDLARHASVWGTFSENLVGYSPRMHAVDSVTGAARYLRWQHTWWSGVYSIVLTKAAFMHRDYLLRFANAVPAAFKKHVDEARNCEDLAMAYTIAEQSKAAPVWVDGIVYEVSAQNAGGISAAGTSHFDTRSHCLDVLRDTLREAQTSAGASAGAGAGAGARAQLPWVAGYQKVQALALHHFDL